MEGGIDMIIGTYTIKINGEDVVATLHSFGKEIKPARAAAKLVKEDGSRPAKGNELVILTSTHPHVQTESSPNDKGYGPIIALDEGTRGKHFFAGKDKDGNRISGDRDPNWKCSDACRFLGISDQEKVSTKDREPSLDDLDLGSLPASELVAASSGESIARAFL